MNSNLYRELNADAKAWWYFKELRKLGNTEEARRKERESIRSSVLHIRATIKHGGWCQVGHGGKTLHMAPGNQLSGFGPRFLNACILAGIPVMDSTEVAIEDVYNLAVSGPMPGFEDDQFGNNPDGSLSSRHWSTIFNRYAACDGAKFWNYTPDPKPWS